MDETKAPTDSLGIWGGVLALVPSLIAAGAVSAGVNITSNEIAAIITNLLTALGGALAIYGRWRATKRIAPP